MSWARIEAPERSDVDEALGTGLPLGETALQVWMRDLPGPAGPIDWIAHDGAGTPTVVRFAPVGEGLRALGALLAERTWLASRLAEWLALQPTLPFQAGRGVRCVLLSPDPEPALRAAAEGLGSPGVEIVRIVAVRARDGRHLALLGLGSEGARGREVPGSGSAPRTGPRAADPPPPPPEPTGFRTGLRDEDLALAGRPRSAPRSRP